MHRAQIRYRSGYKYQLVEEYSVKLSVIPEEDIHTQFIDLSTSGELVIRQWYAWDGPSGPSIDSKNFMRGSLVHDALYQLMRQRLLSSKWHRNKADRLYRRLLVEDKVSRASARIQYIGLKYGGRASAHPSNARKVRRAPRRGRVKDVRRGR